MSDPVKRAFEKIFGLPVGPLPEVTMIVTTDGKTEVKTFPLRRRDDK